MTVNNYLLCNLPACYLFIIDDGVWEGPETLRVELELVPNESLGAELSVDASSTVVLIDDSEDSKSLASFCSYLLICKPSLIVFHAVPTIEFRNAAYEATEPLSNFDIDTTIVTLTLDRHGDLSYTTAVRYTIEGESASFQSPRDPSQEVVFHRQESSKELQIVLRANHDEDRDRLTVKLVEGRVLDNNASVPVRIGQLEKALIFIEDGDYDGPIFPDLPVVANDGDLIMHESLFYDLPLHCITVSDVINVRQYNYYFFCTCSHAPACIWPRGRDSTAVGRVVLHRISLRKVLCSRGRFLRTASISQP